MKSLTAFIGLLLLISLTYSTYAFGYKVSRISEVQDSMKILEKYSLFSEYHKNKDYVSALPFGWEVLEIDPAKFKKWIYYKMESALWFVHDSTDITPEEQKSLEDTTMYLYSLALTYFPEDKSYFESHKAFIMENWMHSSDEDVMKEYEKAIADNKDMSSYYYDRLGKLYIKDMSDDNDYKTKALDIYTYLSEREPDNPQWPAILEGLVDNIDELLKLTKENWLRDKDNLGKAWKFVQTAMRAGAYSEAIEGLEFLISKSPETINYHNQIATAYYNVGRFGDAENTYMKLIELEPDKKDNYYNLATIYVDLNKYSKARQYFEKASDIAGGWGKAIMSIGHVYEQSATDCSTNGFETKLVYKLAQDTYRRAYSIDPTLTNARDRAGALSGVIPTQEDYFFRGYKSGTVIPITGDCFTWIGKSVTVP